MSPDFRVQIFDIEMSVEVSRRVRNFFESTNQKTGFLSVARTRFGIRETHTRSRYTRAEPAQRRLVDVTEFSNRPSESEENRKNFTRLDQLFSVRAPELVVCLVSLPFAPLIIQFRFSVSDCR